MEETEVWGKPWSFAQHRVLSVKSELAVQLRARHFFFFQLSATQLFFYHPILVWCVTLKTHINQSSRSTRCWHDMKTFPANKSVNISSRLTIIYNYIYQPCDVCERKKTWASGSGSSVCSSWRLSKYSQKDTDLYLTLWDFLVTFGGNWLAVYISSEAINADC